MKTSSGKPCLLTYKENHYEFDYTIYSRKAYKKFYKFTTEDRFDISIKQENVENNVNFKNNNNSLEQMRKNEILIKYLKPMTSKLTRILIKFIEKPFHECWKTVSKVEELDKIDEDGLIKPIFILETEENERDSNIDYNLMANDKRITEWEGDY